MVMDIPHYPLLVQRLARILRPGGLLILVESELSYVSTGSRPRSALISGIRTRPSIRVGRHLVQYAATSTRSQEQ